MANFSSNTSLNESYNNYTNDQYDSNDDFNLDDFFDDLFDDFDKTEFIMHVATCIIIAISLPLILVAIYSLYSLVQKDNVAPIYVINLLISDLIQLCCLIVMEALPCNREKTDEKLLICDIFVYIHLYGVVVSVGFMVCIALERYLLIAHPLWYRCRRTIKISVVVCVFVWVVPLVHILMIDLVDSPVPFTLLAVILLLPFPLFIFFLGGIFKALSASISVTSDEKRRIVGILVLVLLIYTLLFLPYIIPIICFEYGCSGVDVFLFHYVSYMLLKLSPLADLVLYIFMRKGAIDKLLASLCCCRMDSNDVSMP